MGGVCLSAPSACMRTVEGRHKHTPPRVAVGWGWEKESVPGGDCYFGLGVDAGAAEEVAGLAGAADSAIGFATS